MFVHLTNLLINLDPGEFGHFWKFYFLVSSLSGTDTAQPVIFFMLAPGKLCHLA